jgi:hypothetical protein
LHRALHGAANDAAFELLRDRFGEAERRAPASDLDDVDDDVGLGELGDLLRSFSMSAPFLPITARPRRLYVTRHFVRPLDHDLGDRRLLELLHQFGADFQSSTGAGHIRSCRHTTASSRCD